MKLLHMQITEDLLDLVESYRKHAEDVTGFPVSRAAAVRRLLQAGLKELLPPDAS